MSLGRNTIKGSSFEYALLSASPWTVTTSGTATADTTGSNNVNVAGSGTKGLRLVDPDAGSTVYVESEWIPVTPGRPWTLSLYGYLVSGSGDYYAAIVPNTGATQVFSGTLNGVWGRYTHAYTVPDTATAVKVRLGKGVGAATTGTVVMDLVQFEPGTVANDWYPHESERVAGSLVSDYRPEYRGLVVGSGTQFITEDWSGLLVPASVRSSDTPMQDLDGAVWGRDLYDAREIEISFKIIDWNGIPAEDSLAWLVRQTQKTNKEFPLIFKRPGQPKKRFYVRPRRWDFPSDYELAHGLADGEISFVAADPLAYSDSEYSTTITIANTNTSATGDVQMNGDAGDADNKEGYCWATYTITGPAQNPMVTSVEHGRTMKFNVTLTAGQTMVVDSKKKTIKINGVDSYNVRANDNQWFPLLPGRNRLTYTRAVGAAQSPLGVLWRDTYVR